MMVTPAHAAEINVVAAGAVRGISGGLLRDYYTPTGLKFNSPRGPIRAGSVIVDARSS